MRRVLAGVAVALGLLPVASGLAQARSAEPRHLVLEYAVYVGGFRAVTVAYEAALGPASYEATVSLNGRGILDWWFAWTMKAFSHGRLTQRGVVPVRAGADSTWKGKNRRARLYYRPDGPPAVELDPAPQDDDRNAVGPALREGARDLAGAVLALLARVGAENRCDGREAVFDGRRRYDLVLAHHGEDYLEGSSYSSYAGPALRCSLEIDRIAGYRRDSSRARWLGEETATVWLAPAFADLPPVPVRLERDTKFGALRAHLVRATLAAGGTMRSLAQAR